HDERSDEAAPPAVVGAHGDEGRADPQHRPDQLTGEEGPGRPVIGGRRDRRGRQHPDGARDGEAGDRAQQPERGWRAGPGERRRRGLRPRSPDGHGGHRVTSASFPTSAAKSSPRAAYDSYQSNDAHAGESSTTSPAIARAAAACTASRIEPARVTSTP